MAFEFTLGEDIEGAEIKDCTAVSDIFVMEKAAFRTWISEGYSKHRSPDSIIAAWDKVSDQLLRKKLLPVSLWEIAYKDVFFAIFKKVSNDKLLRVTDNGTYIAFIEIGTLYFKFLKSKSVLHKAPFNFIEPDNTDTRLTIKEAIIRVLEAEQHGLTVEQIYNKIVANGFYSFGAQNPQNVLRVELDRACENSNYSVRASRDFFRFERDKEGKKVYSLISATSKGDIVHPVVANFTESAESKTVEPSEKQPLLVNFHRPELCAQTRPMTCEINGQAVILDKQKWSRLLVAITERFITEKNSNIAVLDGKSLYGNKIFLMPKQADFGTCSLLSNGKWIYTNYNPQVIVKIIGNLCRHCGVALENVVITYLPKDEFIPKDEQNILLMSELKAIVNDETKAIVVAILEEHFPNGIRPNSVIDINKLKSYYNDVTGGEIISTDIDISSLLKAIGILHGEKVYAVSSRGKKGLAELLDRLISEDTRLFYYDEFYDAYAGFFQTMHVFSAELLKIMLPNILPSFSYLRTYFGVTSKVTVESELLRCYKTTVCLSYEQLKAKLPYVPLDKIKLVLAQNRDFIWVSTGVYTLVGKIEIDRGERGAAEEKVEAEVAEHGYASLASLDVSKSLELNPNLSETAVRNGLFQVCLADHYEKRGNIITQKGGALNSVAVFKDYCLTHDRLTIDELLGFEKEINGSVHSHALFVAYDIMVRVDKNTFINDSEISFDVEATDNALALFVHAHVIPLRAVTSFNSFPHIDGYPWNWFLLESYCKRFSRQFEFQCLSVSSRNVGAIFHKSAGFTDYATVLATAVAAAAIELNEKKVGDFLFEKGYVARRTGFVSDVIAEVRILKERRAWEDVRIHP